MEQELDYALEEFSASVGGFIRLVHSADAKFVRREGRLEFDDSPVPVLSEEVMELPAYEKLHTLISADPAFKDAQRKVGAWGCADTLIEEMVRRAIKTSKGTLSMDKTLAKSYLENFRSTLSLKELNYTIFRRILGLEIVSKKIELDENTSLIRLDEKDLNERMPCLSMLEIGMPYLDLTQHTTELRCTVTQSLKGAELEFLNPSRETREILLDRSDTVLASLILTKKSMLELGPYYFELNFVGKERLFEQFNLNNQFMLPVYPNKIIIDENDLETLKSSYRYAKKICSEASVLNSALKRFIIGCKRVNPQDKLVDYVIALESLLLTVDGNPVKGELSYRFGLNGSSILHWICRDISREEGFSLMRTVYECRSIIVHGGGNKKNLQKAMAKVNISALEDLAELIGTYIGKAILWMAQADENKRPYKEKGGWEKLLWTNP